MTQDQINADVELNMRKIASGEIVSTPAVVNMAKCGLLLLDAERKKYAELSRGFAESIEAREGR